MKLPNYIGIKLFVLILNIIGILSAPSCSPLDIMFVVTSNSTLTKTDFDQKIDFVEKCVQHFTIGSNDILVGLITEIDNADVEFQMNDHLDKAELSLAIKFTYFYGGTPKFGSGLTYIRENGMNTDKLGGRPNVPDVVIFLTNGIVADYSQAQTEAKQLTNDGVTVISVGVGDIDEKDLINLASGCHYVTQGPNFSAVNELVGATVNLTCDAFNKVPLNDCECKLVADVVFLLDASESPQDKNDFKTQLSFTQALVKDINVASNETRFAAMTYSTNIHPQFDLLSHPSKAELQKALGFLPFQGDDDRDVEKALSYLATHEGVLPDSLAPRNSLPKVIIVTSTAPLTKPTEAKTQALKLRNLGYTILSIGVGSADPKEVESLASSNKYSKYYSSYSDMVADAPKLAKLICQDKTLQNTFTSSRCGTVGICENGGICINNKMCQCRGGYGGDRCQDPVTTRISSAPSTLTTPAATSPAKPTAPPATRAPATTPAGVNMCQFNPCKNGGLCFIIKSMYFCSCQPGYSGVTCETTIS